jgi:hypothetical protein
MELRTGGMSQLMHGEVLDARLLQALCEPLVRPSR